MRINELESKIERQYGELALKIGALEKAMAENKNSNYAFESRLLSSVDKIDSKMERIQDLVVRTIIKQQ